MKFLKQNLFLLLFASVFMATISSCGKDTGPAPGPIIVTPEPPVSGRTAKEIIKAMGTGFNLGNTFDNGLNSSNPADIKPIIDLYANAGMKHIRIPVTWTEGFGGSHLANSSGNVNFNHARFLQLKEVIDYALDKNLYVVLNTHHERDFKEHYSNTTAQNSMFTNLWTDIATHFKNYPQELIFEILNEPEGAFGDWSGSSVSPFDANGLALTRTINTIGFNAIRNSDELNKNRVVMISTNGMGNHSMIDEVYPSKSSLPGGGNDDFLAIQVHTYDPWGFCGQDGSNNEYPGKAAIETSIINVSLHAKTLGVPINYGEYGVGRATNQQSRNTDIVREYYKTVVQMTLAEGMSSTVWDDRGWFGLIGKNGNGDYQFIHNIVPFMLP